MGLSMNMKLITSMALMILSNLSTGSFAMIDCSDALPGMFISDPQNCHNYYICAEEGDSDPTLGLCSDGGCFNPGVGSCFDADGEYCTGNCTDASGKTTASTTQTTTTTTPTTEKTISTTPNTSTTPTTVTTSNTASTPTTATIPSTAITSNTVSTPNTVTTPNTASTLNTATTPSTSSIPNTVTTPNTASTPTISSTLTTTTARTTEPTTNKPVMCGNDVQGTMKPDPTDCRKFFICSSSGEWYLLPCGGDSCFVEELYTCYENSDFCSDFCGDSPVTSTTITPTTPTDIPANCIDLNDFVCPSKGYFAKCNYCIQEYFSCSAYGKMPRERKCSGSLMFNPDPTYPYCVRPDNCPQSPNGD